MVTYVDHQTFRLDMTMMFAVHDALRRDAARLAAVAARPSDDPNRVQRMAAGWTMFKSYLHVHHSSEDATIWPVMREALADRPDDIALLDAMEAEHAVLGPLLDGIDAALRNSEHSDDRLAELVDVLVTSLAQHLAHEERDVLALIDATMSPEQWQAFSEDHKNRIGSDASRYLPWVLDGADPARVEAILGRMPEHLQRAYADSWAKEYQQLSRW